MMGPSYALYVRSLQFAPTQEKPKMNLLTALAIRATGDYRRPYAAADRRTAIQKQMWEDSVAVIAEAVAEEKETRTPKPAVRVTGVGRLGSYLTFNYSDGTLKTVNFVSDHEAMVAQAAFVETLRRA